jgi:hypothetical protein
VTRDDLIKILGEWVRVTNPHAPVTWTGQLVGLADDPSLLLRIGPGQQATLPQRFDVEHLELDPANEADDEHGKPLHCRDCAQAWLDGKPTPPQDGPHAPQDGPEAPDAGAETPDGAGRRQTGAEGRETLREQYAAAMLRVFAPSRHLITPEEFRIINELTDAVLAVRDRKMDQLAAALREVLACLYSLERVGGSVIGYQTVNVIPPTRYDRWQAVLDGKEQP